METSPDRFRSAEIIHPDETSSSTLVLHVSARFARLFQIKLEADSQSDNQADPLAIWSVDLCTLPLLGRFVLFSLERSLFTLVLSLGYGRSLSWVLEEFRKRRKEMASEFGVSELAPLSLVTPRFGKRTNRHIIGSQNDLIYQLVSNLEPHPAPLPANLLRTAEDSLNIAPMSYLGMDHPRSALLNDLKSSVRKSDLQAC